MFNFEHFLQQGSVENEALKNEASSSALIKVNVPVLSPRRNHPNTSDPKAGYVNMMVIHWSIMKNVTCIYMLLVCIDLSLWFQMLEIGWFFKFL